ncbi:putative esterase and lipase [Podospora fimiseda]|uniref:Esterase and lipase n=1 Tax=Podospora fimiseda TaxID=252190 RepID=A0AAN7H5I9_9PEZI|nr:putative esterase and lipase [Podospora fimiseda]
MSRSFFFLLTWGLVALCSPLKPLGVTFETKSSLPILTLPYGSYRAAEYRQKGDLYVFRNIRFAAPPVGNLRWAKPAPPQQETKLQDGSYGPKCIQSAPNGLNLVGPGNGSPIGAAINQFLGGIPIPLFSGGDEDCLFLDVYVPSKVLNNPSAKLPVAVWIYGGAFIFGSKDVFAPDLPFYDGSGIIGQSNNNMIFVALNYRMGAYGFLAGTTVEKDGLANAGLWDQRAGFQWVKDYISLLGGDPSKVTAMGESAGASSIMHHLVAQGGTLDPLFSRAILQSPAYQLMWDRSGSVETTFQNFATLAGCKGQGLSCLRAADSATLIKANKALGSNAVPGSFATGPTPDGKFIRQMPVLELALGKFWKVESLVVSHTADEGSLFVAGSIQTDTQFSKFLTQIFPNSTFTAGINQKIEEFYPPINASGKKSKYATQTARYTNFVQHSCFTCSVRYLTEALGPSKTYLLQYNPLPLPPFNQHGSDLLATFFSDSSTPGVLDDLAGFVFPLFKGVSTALQRYLASFITTGDPNNLRKLTNIPPMIRWDHPSTGKGERLEGVLEFGPLGLGMVSDKTNERSPCDFWRKFSSAVTVLGGYAPPGEVVEQDWVVVDQGAWGNFPGGN